MAWSVYFEIYWKRWRDQDLHQKPGAWCGDWFMPCVFWSRASTFDTSWPHVAKEKFCWLPSDLATEKKTEGGSDPLFENSWPAPAKTFALVKAAKAAGPACAAIQCSPGREHRPPRYDLKSGLILHSLLCYTSAQNLDLMPQKKLRKYTSMFRTYFAKESLKNPFYLP